MTADDPAFERPTKPIGPVYDAQESRRLADERGWTVAPDGPYFRRVVPSHEPGAIVELETIERLVSSGVVVVCAGGGGIPVVADGRRLRGGEAVIDKDRTAALLAEKLKADRLIMLTDVPCVEREWGSPAAQAITVAAPAELRQLSFAACSMGPKVEAACGSPSRPAARPSSDHWPNSRTSSTARPEPASALTFRSRLRSFSGRILASFCRCGTAATRVGLPRKEERGSNG